ncbi:MAG: hypothetical protein ACETWR_16075 [Anaerolineae bacterium]
MVRNVESAQWWKFTEDKTMVATGQSLDQYLASLGAEYMHIIALATRPRFAAGFCATLEHVHFPPGTAANERFHITGVLWEDVAWLVVSIPGEYDEVARKLLQQHGLTLAKGRPAITETGVVVTIAPDTRRLPPVPLFGNSRLEDCALFPIFRDNVFTVESATAVGSGGMLTGMVRQLPNRNN